MPESPISYWLKKQKIQRIAAQAEKEGAVLLVAGDKTHPEVHGIVGHTRGEVFVFAKTPRSTIRAEEFCSRRSQKVSVPTVNSISNDKHT